MKTRITRLTLILSVFSMILFATLSAAGQTDPTPVESNELLRSVPSQNPHAAIGTWIVQTQITNCSGVTLESFSKLVSINAGGTAQETSSSTLFRSTGLGVWQHVEQNRFVYALRFFRFNPDGTPSGSVRAKWAVLMGDHGDTYTATGAIQIVLPNGVVVANLCGTETALRMVVPE